MVLLSEAVMDKLIKVNPACGMFLTGLGVDAIACAAA